MEAIRTPKVKICCTQTVAEARMAISAGADWIGLVSWMPSGPGVIPEERIAEIAHAVKGEVTTVLLTSRQDAESIIRQARRSRVDTLQLVDAVPPEELRTLRSGLPSVQIFQVIHVIGEESLHQAKAVSTMVDGLLLDSGNPCLEVKELGGTGRVHDWSVSRRIREELDIPILLAGGLHPGNVQAAISQVGPYGVDVCSGVRTLGALDSEKLQAFMQNARSL